MLEIRGVKKVYETGGVKRVVLNNVSINFRTSEFVAILGPSGSGKTTLLNIIGGLDNYTSGDLIINEKSTKKFKDKDWDSYRNHRIGFVFQSYNLIPHQTVLANVRLALTLSGISKKESIRRAKNALKDVGLVEHMNKRPAQLSGGQMQRVAIARALVNDPDILLADEPTGALDSETSIQIMDLLKKIADKKLVVVVTHNPELADKYANRIITLKDGIITSDSNPYDGKIKTNLDSEKSKSKHKKTKMSFLTALSLSLNNLLTKKGRTILVSVAGSIGIIGIALISAVSTGFQNYIDSIEEDTLTSYPLALMEESADLTGILLSVSGGNGNDNSKNIVKENQILTGALGSVSHNDLTSFMSYLNNHYDEISEDIHLIEKEYNIDPSIYTIDSTGELAKLNPSNLFTSLIGDSSLLSNYSSLTSVFQQYELDNMKENANLLAGRWRENYNEMVISLRDPSLIPDLMTYSLGFHDTQELNEIVAKILSGENVDIKNEPLELTFDDLMNVDLRLIPSTEIYKFNTKYDVYEDMSGDKDYMQNLYDNKSEKLKIVGIVTPNSEMAASGNGILYLPSLVAHIINEAEKTEIVKKQLDNPTIDIFSNTKFGEEGNDFDFEFSDLVSVDNEALSKAFNVKIDQNAISTKTSEYINNIGNDIADGAKEVPTVREVLVERFKSLTEEMVSSFDPSIIVDPETAETILNNFVEEFISGKDFHDLEEQYIIPADSFKVAYTGLLKAYLTAYLMGGGSVSMNDFLANNNISSAFDALSVTIAEIYMKQEILTKVGGLTAYLSNSFSGAFNIDQDALVKAFKLNFTEEELSRVVTAMFTKKESTLSSNLSALGYQDLEKPTRILFYFASFDGKTHFMKFLDNYNDLMHSYNDEEKVIDYTDTTGILMSSVKTIVDAVSYVLIAFVSISLVVSSIMIGVITYISVYERTKEIGILRAIGASKHNISSIFNAETFIIGFLSGIFGITISYILIPIINLVLHHFTGDIPLSAKLDPNTALILVILSVILTLIGGLIPARSASKKDPVEALRSE